MLRMLAVIALLLVAAAPVSAMDFRLLRSGGQRVVLASGPIVAGDAERLAGALALASRGRNGTKQLRLDSPGGNVGEAFAMAQVMDQARVSTVIPSGSMCGSACASVLFVSGKYRTVDKGGALVIHSCYDARSNTKVSYCNAMISQHAQDEGSSGIAMMALQEAAGTRAAFVLDSSGAACFGLTRKPGTSARKVSAPCIEAALRDGRRR